MIELVKIKEEEIRKASQKIVLNTLMLVFIISVLLAYFGVEKYILLAMVLAYIIITPGVFLSIYKYKLYDNKLDFIYQSLAWPFFILKDCVFVTLIK